jgi:hypothetical protein
MVPSFAFGAFFLSDPIRRDLLIDLCLLLECQTGAEGSAATIKEHFKTVIAASVSNCLRRCVPLATVARPLLYPAGDHLGGVSRCNELRERSTTEGKQLDHVQRQETFFRQQLAEPAAARACKSPVQWKKVSIENVRTKRKEN